jgi:hypothetical protein
MSQITLTLDGVTSDTTGEIVSFITLNGTYTMHYVATIPSGMATISTEWSWDGVNWFTGQSVVVSDNGTGFLGGPVALFVRGRVTGLASGRTVTARIAVPG